MSFNFLKQTPFAMAIATIALTSHAQKVMPTLISTKYTLTMGNMTFQATAKNSGRIQSVKHSGTDRKSTRLNSSHT